MRFLAAASTHAFSAVDKPVVVFLLHRHEQVASAVVEALAIRLDDCTGDIREVLDQGINDGTLLAPGEGIGDLHNHHLPGTTQRVHHLFQPGRLVTVEQFVEEPVYFLIDGVLIPLRGGSAVPSPGPHPASGVRTAPMRQQGARA